MKRINLKIRSENGFSLIETLIALFMTGVVLASLFGVYINQHKNWIIQEQVTDMQQNGRASIDELTRQIRMAGHELPMGLQAIEAYNTNPDTIVVTYEDDGCNAPISHEMPQPSSELRCDGYDISCFYDGEMVYIYYPDSNWGQFFTITQVQTSSAHIQHNTTDMWHCYPAGSLILTINRIKYFIDRSDTLHPKLMMEIFGKTPEVYAENIEDMQFRYRMKNGAVVDVPASSRDIREVLISITARADRKDVDFPGNPYRRRIIESTVNLRNLDI